MTPTTTHSMMVMSASESTRTRQRFAVLMSTRAAQINPSTYAIPYQRTEKGPTEKAIGSRL